MKVRANVKQRLDIELPGELMWTGTHPNTFRTGESAKVLDVVIMDVEISIEDTESRICLEVEYADGMIDYIPLVDYPIWRFE